MGHAAREARGVFAVCGVGDTARRLAMRHQRGQHLLGRRGALFARGRRVRGARRDNVGHNGSGRARAGAHGHVRHARARAPRWRGADRGLLVPHGHGARGQCAHRTAAHAKAGTGQDQRGVRRAHRGVRLRKVRNGPAAHRRGHAETLWRGGRSKLQCLKRTIHNHPRR